MKLTPIYIQTFLLMATSVVLPFFTIYFINKGFSFFQIGIMMAVYGLTVFFAEVPTGAFADTYGRKRSTLLGYIILIISLSLIPIFTNIFILMGLWVITGIGSTFISGAFDSWIVDNIGKDDDMKKKYFVRYQIAGSAGIVVGPLLGTLLVSYYSMDVLWWVWSVGLLVSFAILIRIPENYVPVKFKSAKKLSVEGWNYVIRHPFLFLLLCSIVMLSLAQAGYDGWQPFLGQLSLPVSSLGIVYSAYGVFGILVGLLSSQLFKFKVKNVLISSALLQGLLLLLVFFLVPPQYAFGIGLFLMVGSLHLLNGPVINKIIHDNIPTSMRATVLSMYNMGLQGSLAVVTILAGLVMDIISVQFAIAVCSVFAIVAAVMFSKVRFPKVSCKN